MPTYESPRARYRELAEEALEAANAFAPGEQREALLQMAQVWHRLADQYEESPPPVLSSAEQPAMQQQQQIQPDDDEKP